MRIKILTVIVLGLFFASCKDNNDPIIEIVVVEDKNGSAISEKETMETSFNLKEKYNGEHAYRIDKGVNQIASLWQNTDGDYNTFNEFCLNNFISDSTELSIAYNKLEKAFEIVFGYSQIIEQNLNQTAKFDKGKMHLVDEIMGAYSIGSNFTEDMYNNKLGFFIALNFPEYSLEEKNKFANKWSRLDWAYARMGDVFTARVPSKTLQNAKLIFSKSSNYISQYNIYMGNIIDKDMNTIFPKDLILSSHWGLCSEIKSQYGKDNGFLKQKTIYDIMRLIIKQDIPQEVINNNEYLWNPNSNTVYKDKKEIEFNKEPYTRYQHLLLCFKANMTIDKYNSRYPNFIDRTFEQTMEISRAEVEQIFTDFMRAPELKQVSELIKSRLGRDLEPFDIWYDGFKIDNDIDKSEINTYIRKKYPNLKSFEKDIPKILQSLGWTKDKSLFITNKINVDANRSYSFQAGAKMKGNLSHLGIDIDKKGMDYKSYENAIHELGHSIEQTISLYDTDYYMLKGVPNEAIGEAIAYAFQINDIKTLKKELKKKDLDIQNALYTLNNYWATYATIGPALLDIYVWDWMYKNVDSNPKELKENVERIAIEIWNKYYFPVFGKKDSNILAIYSQMFEAPLYLSNYPLGLFIEFQISKNIRDENFANEISRIILLGKLTPQEWMKRATGNQISSKILINEVKKALKTIN